MTPTPDTEAGLWSSISDLAIRKGVTKQTLAERVSRLEAQGRLTTRPGKNRSKLVNIAEYDRAVGETTDLSHAAGAATKRMVETGSRGDDDDTAPLPAGTSASSVYTQEQARHMAYKASMAELDLNERLGKLIPFDDLAKSAQRVAEMLVRQIDQVITRADEVAAAVARDGVQGARAALKTIARDLRKNAATALSKLGAPADDATTAPSADDGVQD